MTVDELILALQAMPGEYPVKVSFGGCAVRPLTVEIAPATRHSRPLAVIRAEGWYES